MGWLFAVALGLQERSRAAVLRAFGPLALAHAASVIVVVAVVGMRVSPTGPKLWSFLMARAHRAFTWGVLDTLLADERVDLDGLSGSSAGL